ncbi:MAG: (Fe-S)-binding protein, partial [Candidatus Thermoplasmatota archaeon]|nr:(Fe-S)-binding protein [Candidatus Thermoplasmatota archaeon]
YDLWKGARGRVILGKELLNSVKSENHSDLQLSDSFYSCLDCFACLQVCPAGVNAGVVSHLSRSILTDRGSKIDENPYAKMIVAATMKYMNPLGIRKGLDSWASGLKFSDHSENLLYTGNMYQLMAYTGKMNAMRSMMGSALSRFMAGLAADMPSLVRISATQYDGTFKATLDEALRNIAELLKSSGVDFSYMGGSEPYPGTFIYDLGYLREFREYSAKVYGMLKSTGARRIITVDPHTYDLLRNVYPKYVDGFDLEVVFYADMLEASKIHNTGKKVAFHEPCHFVLRTDAYNRPLELLKSASEVLLPSRSGKRTRCCGGPDELIFPDLSEKISRDRYAELESTGADEIVTACPICLSNLSKGGKVRDMSGILIQSLRE